MNEDLVVKRMTKKLRKEGAGIPEDSAKWKGEKREDKIKIPEDSAKWKGEKREDAIKELRRTIRGQINRLTSSNLPSIGSLIENLYHKNSLFQVNECVCECIHDLIIVDGTMSPIKLISELALLIATLQVNVGDEVAGHAVHFFVSIFDRLNRDRLNKDRLNKDRLDPGSKKLDNLLLFFCHLYSVSVFDSTLILELMHQLLEEFDEKSIELILNMLISVGFILRKNSPSQMKLLIRSINSRANEAQSSITNKTKTESTTNKTESTTNKTESTTNKTESTTNKTESVSNKRIEFMLETLAEIRNNNIMKVTSKCSGVIVPIDRDILRNTLKNSLKKANKVTPLLVTYDQALSSNRWWVKVGSLKERQEGGSSESVPGESSESVPGESSESVPGGSSESILEGREEKLCRMLRLNTSPLRRSLFKALISSADIVEACSRMITMCSGGRSSEGMSTRREGMSAKRWSTSGTMNTKAMNTSEATNVILQVALHESTFNPFYVHLLSRLCHFDRRFKLSTHFAVTDRIHTVEEMSEGMRKRFIQIILQLLVMKVISLSVLKGIEFSDLNQTLVQFLKSIISGIMSHEESLIKEIFDRIPNKDRSFATSIRLFIACFMDETNGTVGKEIIKARIKLNQRNKQSLLPPVDQVRESSEEEVRESSEEEVRESSDEEAIQESSDEKVVRKTPRDQWSLKELEKKHKESIKREDEKERKKQIARKRKLLAKEDSEDDMEFFMDEKSETVGKKTTKFNQRNKQSLHPPVDQARESSYEEVRESSDEEVIQESSGEKVVRKTPHDQWSLKELEKKHKESIKREDEKERKIQKKQIARERKLLMKEDNEDAVIKEMRRKLKLHKRRKTQSAIPRSFYTDGLGDLLDFIEKRNASDDGEEDRDDGDEDTDGREENVL